VVLIDLETAQTSNEKEELESEYQLPERFVARSFAQRVGWEVL